MKNFSLFLLACASTLLLSCEKGQTDADRNAQIENEVQQRLAAERQATEQQPADTASPNTTDLTVADQQGIPDQTITPTRPRSAAQGQLRPRATPARSKPDAPESYDTFYRKLEPYGAWRETSDYGYVWQPQQAQRSRDWRPYTDGRWAYTDAGWTWVSEEPFGWATYHYGRWTRLRNVGWVWVPGDEWAPAWVSWRKSDEYVGWAPLPPEAHFDRHRGIQKWADSYYDIDADEYVFVPNQAIGSQRLEREAVPVEQNVTIVNKSVNVTNITYSNTTIFNEGPNYEELRAQSRQPVERFRLERQYDAETNAPQSVVRGDVLSVTTPVFAARATERPRVIGEPIRQVTVDRSWAANANQAEAQRARAKMKSEATPPPDAPPKRYDKPTGAESTPAAVSSSASPAAIASASATMTPTATAISTPIATATPSATASATASVTASASASATVSPRRSFSPSPSASATVSTTPTPTTRPSATVTATPTGATTPSSTATATAIVTATPTPAPSFTPRVRPTVPPVPSPAATSTPTPAGTAPSTPPTRDRVPPSPAHTPPVTAPVPTITPAAETAADPQTGVPARGLSRGQRNPDGLRGGERPGNPRGEPARAVPPPPQPPITPTAAAPLATPMTPRVHMTPPPPPANTPAAARENVAPPPPPASPRATPPPLTTPAPTSSATPVTAATPAAPVEKPVSVAPPRDPDAPAPVAPGANGRGPNRMPRRPGAPPADPNASPEESPAQEDRQ